MYRQQRRSRLSTLVFLGIMVGIAFIVYDHYITPDTPPVSSSLVPLPTPSASDTPPGSTPVQTVPVQPEISEAQLFIPKAGIYAPIIEVYLDGESWDVSQLGMNVGHLQGTPWLDRPGNIVLSAHVEMADGRAGIFANINTLVIGDLVVIKQGDVEHNYRVTRTEEVEPDNLKPLYPTPTEQVTLITCGSYNFLQDNYLQRVVVIAERID